MLRLAARRAAAQRALLGALLAIVTLGATLLGVSALLVTRTADRAVEVAAGRAEPDDVSVTAYTVDVPSGSAASVRADTAKVLASSLAPFPSVATAQASTSLRDLPIRRAFGTRTETYLSAVQRLPDQVVLTSGRWPRPGRAPVEAVVLESTARVLGLAPGRRMRLGAELYGDEGPALDVTVVGVVRARPGSGWDRDLLGGGGYDLTFADGRSMSPVRAYGPFLTDLEDLLTGSSTLSSLTVTSRPVLGDPARRDLDTVSAAVQGADRRLGRTLGDRVKLSRVASSLPATFQAADAQQRVTGATVLAVAILGSLLAATALALAGRLTAGVRSEETVLLSALGFERRQLAGGAATEAGAVALLGAALAVPLSAGLHAALTRLPPLAGAGLGTEPAVTAPQVAAVLLGALALAAVLVVPVLRTAAPVDGRRDRRELLARSGADLVLVALAVAGWWQLRSAPTGADTRTDAVRVLAPALLLVAGSALALRVVRPALRGADRLARRGLGLVPVLATSDAARRHQAVAAGLLIGLTCAAGTFGVAYEATWQRSQRDQADLAVGTDLAVTLNAPPATGDGAALAAATGGTVSAATDRGVVVGQWLGGTGEVPHLVAVDTRRADAIVRGRLDDGRTWMDIGRRLTPREPVTGVPVPAGARLTFTGTATGRIPLTVAPRLVLQDAAGVRTACTGRAVVLDGKPHPLPECSAPGEASVVAVSLPVSYDPLALTDAGDSGGSVAVTLHIPGPSGPAARWSVHAAPPATGALSGFTVAVGPAPGGTDLRLDTLVQLAGFTEDARDLVATAFPVPPTLPVAVSHRIADQLNRPRGTSFTLTVGTTPVDVKVTEVVSEIPSAPGAAGILADADALSRALITNGRFESAVDALWVGGPTRADAAARAAGLHLGRVTTRQHEAAELAAGPLRAGLPAALRLLVPAAVLLLLAGIVLHVTCDLHLRAVEVARLRGLGLSRRDIRRVLLGQHAAIVLPLLVTGALAGGLATWLVAPLLVRSATGAVPAPAAVPLWPWGLEAGLLATFLAGCALAVTVVVTVQARRADAAHLRVVS